MTERVYTSPTDYHRLAFNPKLLPDLQAAGPVSASVLHDSRDPIKFLTERPKEQTPDMKWGSMVDCLWLTPESWDEYFVTLPENQPKRPSPVQLVAYEKGTAKQPTIDAVEFWRTWDSRARSRTLVTREELERVRIARNMLDAHPVARYIWEASEKQAIFIGDIPGARHQNAKGKAMLDILPMDGSISVGGTDLSLQNCIVDLKQCHNVSEYGMKQAIHRFEYHMRLNWYRRMAQSQEGFDRPHLVLIFQNSNPPHDVHIRVISDDDNRDGVVLCQQRLDRLSQLDHRDLRPLFDIDVKIISMAGWMKAEQEEER